METIKIFVGYDPREAICYHTFCQSVLSRASVPVSFHPLALSLLGGEISRRDGSNDFSYSRFLVPWLCDYTGWAIYADGDMVCLADIVDLMKLRDPFAAVSCVQHEYETKSNRKYLDNENVNYPKKNWSSLMIWNCGHYGNKVLTPDYVRSMSGKILHRFEWLPQEGLVGSLPLAWNWLPQEYGQNDNAKILHWTLGAPCFFEHAIDVQSSYWFNESLAATNVEQSGKP